MIQTAMAVAFKLPEERELAKRFAEQDDIEDWTLDIELPFIYFSKDTETYHLKVKES